jgi:hypothetical protein
MKQLTLNSERYPGLGAPVPQVPGAPDGTSGGFTFSVGVPYEVTDETAEAIKDLLARTEERVSRHYRLTIMAVPGAITDAIADPAAAAVADVDEPIALSEEDQDLIGVEVAKLKGLTAAETKPLVDNTAGNEELPVVLRRAYLQAVIESRPVKATSRLATEWLETLAD